MVSVERRMLPMVAVRFSRMALMANSRLVPSPFSTTTSRERSPVEMACATSTAYPGSPPSCRMMWRTSQKMIAAPSSTATSMSASAASSICRLCAASWVLVFSTAAFLALMNSSRRSRMPRQSGVSSRLTEVMAAAWSLAARPRILRCMGVYCSRSASTPSTVLRSAGSGADRARALRPFSLKSTFAFSRFARPCLLAGSSTTLRSAWPLCSPSAYMPVAA
jgi:hypothetical protein